MKKLCKLNCFLLALLLVTVTFFCSTSLLISAKTITTGYVNGTGYRIRSAPSTSGQILLSGVSNCTITINETVQGGAWYNVTYNGVTGYISGENIINIKTVTIQDDLSFEEQLNAFPESYKESLRLMHAVYPNWSFYPDNLTITLDEAVAKQNINRKKEVSGTAGISWRSMGQGAFDWGTNEWAVDNGNWVGASREVIAYYMDPRNFLDSSSVIMFMDQKNSSASQTIEGVNKIIAGTFLANGYSDPEDPAYGGSYANVIMAASAQTGVSPYVIAATIIQEQGTGGTSSLISGTTSYGKYYNFFNVKASGSTSAAVIQNGLNHAIKQGWNTRSKSIIGGAQFLATNYLNAGQDTYFYMNYNCYTASHQYAQAVHNALSSGKIMAKSLVTDTYQALSFKIPVYKNMPETAAACPEQNGNRNNYYFTSMTASNNGLTPTFSMFDYNYNLLVTGNSTINVTVPEGASIITPAAYSLSPGDNKVVLTVCSESGYTTDYTINVNAATSCTLSVPGGVGGTTPTPDPTPDPPPTTVIRGDTNGDSKISLIDLANIQKHLLGLKVLTGDNFTGADTNSDGKISLIDLANVQKHLLGVKLLNQ